jgi:murein tripeptide amidase MpaA
MFKAAILLLALVCVNADEEFSSFEGHQVLRLHLLPEQLARANEIAWNSPLHYLDWWRFPAVNSTEVTFADVRVTPERLNEVRGVFDAAGFQYMTMISNVQSLADRQLVTATDRLTGEPLADWFTAYHDYPSTVSWLQDLVKQYSSIATLFSIGTSYQNRTIWAVKVTGNKNTGAPKPGIFYDGGIHAREWIAPATVQFVLYTLVSQYGKDADVTKLVDQVEWTIVPIFNTDGYQYTWSNNRMWRKTRMPNKGSSCIGTDPCRNSDYHWGEAGASADPCSDTYRGAKAFDNPEVLAIANAVKAPGNMRGYINFHSYSQLYMGPWSYTYSLPPQPDLKLQTELGQAAVAAIKATHGVNYKYGPGAATIYPASGDISDYNYGATKVLYAYCVELRDTGRYGFLLPPEQIIPTGEEIFASAKVMANYILAHPEARATI